MIHKWKQILTNWINCYLNDNDKKQKHVEIDSLLTIISHLHENLNNLDESKSSILEAHNIEEFIEEKYPQFKFENGTVEPTSDEEIHIAASLLLFFVCVNSKDLDLKSAMCSKLSTEDQETIMRFSTNLMAVSPVTFRDVEFAIAEACGQDTGPSSSKRSIAETPPALRSLHGEVRRLQAALDAEKFDRNYLQEELARNNLKLEKLVKDKEQYKLDILNLKAKISLCCGQEAQAGGSDAVTEGSARLTRQLEDLEERLVATQEKLDDALSERDAYRTKVDELKKERDKWLSLSQEESTRAIQLAEELETERNQVHSLKELVLELRIHHQNNRLDGSHIECDDPDMSLHSTQNASVCSEACANVVEVQLGEERAKILVLKQQIQTLQDQLNELANKAETEKLDLEGVISKKDNDILSLKHRINEEIEEKNNLQAHYTDEFTKMNNELSEVEQKLKDTNENATATIQQKLEEVKTLQEEKLSLLQSLNDETTKLEEMIKVLQTDLDTEKNLKLKMKENYENHMMKLNEKVLNRNNELVELQNKVFEQSEAIETLNFDLRKQKESYEEFSSKYQHDITKLNEEKSTLEADLQKKTDEAKELQRRLLQNVKLFEEFNKDIDDLKASNAELAETCKSLEESKESLLIEYRQTQMQYDECQKELEDMRIIIAKENENYCRHLDERTAMINNLQIQLQGEISYKTTLQIELSEQQQTTAKMSEEIKTLNAELSEIKKEVHEKDRMIYAIDLYLKEEKHTNKQLKEDHDALKEELSKLREEIEAKEKEIKSVQEKLEQDNQLLEEELRKRDAILENSNEKLSAEKKEIASLRDVLTTLRDEKEVLDKVFTLKCEEMFQLKTDYEILSEISDKNNKMINELEKRLEDENAKYLKLEINFDTHTSNLMAKLDETKKALEKTQMQMNNIEESKDLEIQTLQHEKDKLHIVANNIREKMVSIENQKEGLLQKLEEEIAFRNNIEKEYLNQCAALNDLTNKLNDEIALKNKEIHHLNVEISSISETLKQQTEDIKDLQEKLTEANQRATNIEKNKDIEIKVYQMKVEELHNQNNSLELEMKKEMEIKVQTVDKLQKEKEEGNNNHELLLREKDNIIDGLQEQLKSASTKLDSLREHNEVTAHNFEKLKEEIIGSLNTKDNQIESLKEHVNHLKNSLEQNLLSAKQEKEELMKQIDEVVCKTNESDVSKKEQIISLIAEVNKNEVLLTESERANVALKESLENEKLARETLETEKNILKIAQEQVINELCNVKLDINKLQEEREELVNKKQSLEEEIDNEKIAKESVIKEKDDLNEQLLVLITEKDTLLEEKDCLTQQLVDEKTVREMLEQEKKVITALKTTLEQNLKNEILFRSESEQEKVFLNQEKHDLIDEINVLNQQIMEEISAKEYLYQEKVRLTNMLEEERVAKGDIYNEKEFLIDENEGLKHSAIETQAVVDALNNDKEILSVEKEALVKSLSEEKAACDEMETEKKSISDKLLELESKYYTDLGEKQIEIQNINIEINNLKADLKKHEDVNTHLESMLNSGVDKLLHNIKKEKISNEVLQKLIAVKKSEHFTVSQSCDLLINIAETLTTEVSMRRNLEKALEHENTALNELRCMFKQKEMQILDLQTEVKKLEQVIQEGKGELAKQLEAHTLSQESNIREVQKLQLENQSLINQLNDVKVQLEVKVHSLKEKLVDNENLTDKLKKTYECQIDNLNIMVTKLTSYLKDKTIEIETMRKEKERLQNNIDDNHKVIKQLEEDVKLQKQNQEKLISDFESERLVLKNMVTVTESVMEDQKVSLNKIIDDHLKANEALQGEIKILQDSIETEKKNTDVKIKDKDVSFQVLCKELTDLKDEKEKAHQQHEEKIEKLTMEIVEINKQVTAKEDNIKVLEEVKEELTRDMQQLKDDLRAREEKANELKTEKDCLEFEILSEIDTLAKTIKMEREKNKNIYCNLPEKLQGKHELQDKIKVLAEVIIDTLRQYAVLYEEKASLVTKLEEKYIELRAECDTIKHKAKTETDKLNSDNLNLVNIIEENKTVISNLEQLIQHELEQNQKLREEAANEKQTLENKCISIQEHQMETETLLQANNKEIGLLKDDVTNTRANMDTIVKTFEIQIDTLKSKLNTCEQELVDKDVAMANMIKEKEAMVNAINDELLDEKAAREKYQSELATKTATVYELKQKLEDAKSELAVVEGMRKENDEMIRAIGQRETFALCQEKSSSHKLSGLTERELRDRHQVSTPTSDLTHSSMDSLKTITDLEKIVHDKNRTITTLQSDITYLKSLLGESENKLLDITKELEISKENCDQLSDQLKKLVNQKNEEIIDLKKQVSKMSVTENRATQIIKVSAKYQAIILKRIQEIKSNTILKELTNFGNANCDTELSRGLKSGTVTMEDLENFLETTDRHLKRCSDKQVALQKERDRLLEVNRINESEILNMKKFLTELSISFKTLNSLKDMYSARLSRVVSVQRTVRREILSLEGVVTDTTMCKLERGYAAVIQDLAECAMNLERWLERCIARTISTEKIKQAFTSDGDRTSMAAASFQNASLEVQLGELETAFQRLLDEASRVRQDSRGGPGAAAEAQPSSTVMEVRAEYEDKLNRMKAKMKQLYQEQIGVFKEQQREEVAALERELQKARDKMAESSRAYEEHIRSLTSELWSVGEKFLMKKDEAEWLRKKQRSGSLMSLQHVHSSGLMPMPEIPSRPSDTHSLRSLPVTNAHRDKREDRNLQMSDEEGEVFDNRWLRELASTPRRDNQPQRLSELQWRNSLCPPHLKSSYPAETQFVGNFDEEELKYTNAPPPAKPQRKEVGITAYKKPGPPTPSKQAGRLSATGSELRESLRSEPDAHLARKTSTPSRIRALFSRSNRTEAANVEGTPRSRRLSNIFRKK